MKISLVMAMGRNGEVGFQGGLPWNYKDYPEDMERFKTLTMNKKVLMGRKTWDSLPNKPLKNRTNFVYSRNFDYCQKSNESPVFAVKSLDELELSVCRILDDFFNDGVSFLPKYRGKEILKITEITIIGGVETFLRFKPYIKSYHLTIIDRDFQADTFFPMDIIPIENIKVNNVISSNDTMLTFLDWEV